MQEQLGLEAKRQGLRHMEGLPFCLVLGGHVSGTARCMSIAINASFTNFQ